MERAKNFIRYSLIAATAVAVPFSLNAATHVRNVSHNYADAYRQINSQRQQFYNQQTAGTMPNTEVENQLPIRVANRDLAARILLNDGSAPIGIEELSNCGSIYPNGEFAWDVPMIGTAPGVGNTCVAVVELRAIQKGVNGEDLILARANLAAGDAAKCNISDFPEVTYTSDVDTFIFPADNAPTREDVVKVMNQEQKQNAALKIIASTIVGGLGGNMFGKSAPGDDRVLSFGKDKAKSTVFGGLAGAAIGVGNVYGGKVAGDVILSTGINAAAGGVMGNMAAMGDSVYRIEKCTVDGTETSCLWGYVITGKDLGDNKVAFFNVSSQDDYPTVVCDSNNNDDPPYINCKEVDLVSIKLADFPDIDLDKAKETRYDKILNSSDDNLYHMDDATDTSKQGNKVMKSGKGSQAYIYVRIANPRTPDETLPALIPGIQNKAFGLKRKDWAKWKQEHPGVKVKYRRSSKGEAVEFANSAEYDIEDFYPIMVGADDGDIIDLGNKARLKKTLTGVGIGGALGAFSAYQGATDEIENRWASSVTEYKDSLQKVYCATGKRFLGFYNDIIMIPAASMVPASPAANATTAPSAIGPQ